MAGKAEARMSLVKARAAVDEKRILTVVACLKVDDRRERVFVDLQHFERNVSDEEDGVTKTGKEDPYVLTNYMPGGKRS